MDEVAVYATALSAGQVLTHYVRRAWSGEGTPVELPLVASDANGDPLVFSVTGLPPGLSLDSATGVISGTLTRASVGTHAVTAAVSDGFASSTQSFTWIVTHVNHAPVLSNPGARNWRVGVALSLSLSAVDSDGDPLTFTATGLPANLSLDAQSGVISGTPAAASVGVHQVTATVTDGELTAAQTFTWSIVEGKQAPVLTNPGPQVNVDATGYAAAVRADGAVAYWRLGMGRGRWRRIRPGLSAVTLSGRHGSKQERWLMARPRCCSTADWVPERGESGRHWPGT